MGFLRFRRSFRLLPDLRLNFGKRSASVSVGVRGAHVTFGGPSGTRTTVGLPGTGISYTDVHKAQQDAPGDARAPHGRSVRGLLWAALVVVLAIALASLARAETAAISTVACSPGNSGHPEIWGFVGVIVGGLLTAGVDFMRRKAERVAKARELRLARGEEILLQLETGLEWFERARKATFEGNQFVPLINFAFRIAALVEIYYPSLSMHARALNDSATAVRQVMLDMAISQERNLPKSGELRMRFEQLALSFPRSVVEMITETRKVVRGLADQAAPNG